MSPIIGERYRCLDCVEKVGFDLCESCYNAPVKILGRFNQQHKPEHQFEVVQPRIVRVNSQQSDEDGSDALPFIVRLDSQQSTEDGSDALEHMDDASHNPTFSAGVHPDQDDGSQEPDDISPSLILSFDVSLDLGDDSDDPSDNTSSHLT